MISAPLSNLRQLISALVAFFVSAVSLGDFRRVNGGLVGDGEVGCLGKKNLR